MKVLGTVLVVLGLSLFGIAQSKEKRFNLSGTISNEVDAVIYGVKIIARSRDGETFNAITNTEGFYEITMPSGRYVIEIGAEGWRPIIISNFMSFSDEQLRMDINHMIGKCHDCYGSIYGADISWQDKPIKINYSKQKDRNKITVKDTHH